MHIANIAEAYHDFMSKFAMFPSGTKEAMILKPPRWLTIFFDPFSANLRVVPQIDARNDRCN
jgi:hypothetical protein